MWLHTFWAMQCTGHIPEADAKLPWQMNLIYYLIYLDDIVIFSWMAEEHLHQLQVVFDQFRDYNLKLELSKCSFLKEINYLAHQVSKEGVQPSDLNLKAITDCALPQTYMEVCTFLGLMGHYQWFIKGFTHITQLLYEHLTGEGSSRKSEQVLLLEGTLKAFKALKRHVCLPPSWLLPTIPNHSCWKLMHPRRIRSSAVSEANGWAVPSRGLWQPTPYASWEKLPFH